MEEVWKDVVGHEGVYQVSSLGRVKRLATDVIRKNQYTTWVQCLDEYVFSPCLDSKGYEQVLLSLGQKKRVARVHRLVAEAFLPTPSEELISECNSAGLDYVLVNHIDNNRTNNNVSNLEWCSPKHNLVWMQENGRQNIDTVKGSLNYNAELTEEDVLSILQLLREGRLSQEKIGQIFNVKQITISNIWTGRSWAWFTGIARKPRSRKLRDAKAISES